MIDSEGDYDRMIDDELDKVKKQNPITPLISYAIVNSLHDKSISQIKKFVLSKEFIDKFND